MANEQAREAAWQKYLACDHDHTSAAYSGPMSVCDVCRGRFSEDSFDAGFTAGLQSQEAKDGEIHDHCHDVVCSASFNRPRGCEMCSCNGREERKSIELTQAKDEIKRLRDESSILVTPELAENLVECVVNELYQQTGDEPEAAIPSAVAQSIRDWFSVAGEKPGGPGYDGFRYE